MYSVMLHFRGRWGETVASEILTSTTRSGASRKANTVLRATFFVPVRKNRLDNWEHWVCRDVADISSPEGDHEKQAE